MQRLGSPGSGAGGRSPKREGKGVGQASETFCPKGLLRVKPVGAAEQGEVISFIGIRVPAVPLP